MTGKWIKAPAVVFAATLVAGGAATDAAAQVTSLLTLTNLRQSVDFSYRFDASQGHLASSTQHGLAEDYRVGINYSVYRARLLHGDVALDLKADQQRSDGSARSSELRTGYGILYNINGVLLDRFPYPVSFVLSSNITQVPREFASSYQQQNDIKGVSVSINNKFLPAAFNYSRSSSETDGLENDRLQLSDSFSFGAAHAYKNIASTEFTLFDTRQSSVVEGEPGSERNAHLDATLNNTWYLGGKEQNRILRSRWRIGNQRGINESRFADFGEYLAWDFGKALSSGLDYTFTKQETIGSYLRQHTSRIWLQHKLFQSLTTRLDLNGSDKTFNTGTEQSAAGALSIGYQKVLPAQSLVRLQGRKEYGISSSKLTDNTLPMLDEPHTASAVDPLILDEPLVVATSIVVRNADSSIRSIPYVENRDYEVRQLGTRTEIFFRVAGSEIQTGHRLLISYQHLVNDNITYAHKSLGVGGDLSLFDSRYRIYASWDGSKQELVSGEADDVNLTSTDSYRLGFERRFASGSFTTEYSNTSTDQDRNQSINGNVSYSGDYRQGRLAVTASERYLIVETSPLLNSGGSRRTSNVLSLGASYSKALENSAVLTAGFNAMDSRGTVITENLTMNLGIQWNLRRMIIGLLSQANFRYSAGELTTDQHLQLRLSRYF